MIETHQRIRRVVQGCKCNKYENDRTCTGKYEKHQAWEGLRRRSSMAHVRGSDLSIFIYAY